MFCSDAEYLRQYQAGTHSKLYNLWEKLLKLILLLFLRGLEEVTSSLQSGYFYQLLFLTTRFSIIDQIHTFNENSAILTCHIQINCDIFNGYLI